uniref:Striatin 4 n=1 Tax=Gadus morhua TaxID=8049 RepID=A0A8C4Z9R0_GADMO
MHSAATDGLYFEGPEAEAARLTRSVVILLLRSRRKERSFQCGASTTGTLRPQRTAPHGDMEADRPDPNGPGAATAAAAIAAAATGAATAGCPQPREPQDGDGGLSLPGILHFIQYEWGRFQAEKYRWEAERDELRAQVAFLQGERKGQENMKQDLVRRIKMLEYALKQEREEEEEDSEDALGEFDFLGSGEEGEGAGEMQDPREELKKTWNPRFTLRSHFDDAIRALTFHPSQEVLLTASEDGTLKLWNLNKAMHSKKNAALDVEPIYTFRAHSGAVLSLAMGPEGEACYSGGLDGSVRCWKIPDLNVDPYDNYDPGVQSLVLGGHEDAVWGLAFSAAHRRLASCSADGSVRVWDPLGSAPCLSVLNKEKERGTPTSVAFVTSDPNQVVVSYDGGDTLLYDLNTEQSLVALETQTVDGSQLIHRVVSHPSEPISITAHDNRTIRFLDNKTGKVVHSMVAHLDAVTCLTTDPKGTYLISGSHDCSVRLWMLDNRTCVQEITAHRKKHDEAIHDVAFHPSQPFIGSAGADALAKVFV